MLIELPEGVKLEELWKKNYQPKPGDEKLTLPINVMNVVEKIPEERDRSLVSGYIRNENRYIKLLEKELHKANLRVHELEVNNGKEL